MSLPASGWATSTSGWAITPGPRSAYRTGDQDQRSRRDRLQQPRLADRAAGRQARERGPRADQQRHPGQGAAAGIPRHPRHDLPERSATRRRHRRPRGGLQGRPQRPPSISTWPRPISRPTTRTKARKVLEAARPGGCPAASIAWRWPAYKQVASELGMPVSRPAGRRRDPAAGRASPGTGGLRARRRSA